MRSATKSCIAAVLLLGMLALLAAPAPSSAAAAAKHKSPIQPKSPTQPKPAANLKYSTKLTPTYTIPPKTNNASLPSGAAVVTIFNTSYAEVSFQIKNIVAVYMAHIHNGTLTAPGPPIVWAFQSTLPPTGVNNPVSGAFYGTVAFNPTTTGVAGLLAAKTAYFNVHTTAYPAGAIAGQFKP